MIPGFAESGLLPPNDNDLPYEATVEEIRQRLVDDLGSPPWRVRLLGGWALVREAVSHLVPSARWWLWGCFVSNHEDPEWGDAQTLSALVILPAPDLPASPDLEMLLGFLQGAEMNHAVDVSFVVEYDTSHPDNLDFVEALEYKYRPRAAKGVADHATRELVAAGFLEVGP